MADEEVVQLTAESESSVFVFATTAAPSSSGASAEGGIYDEEGNIQENSLIENLGRTFFDTGSVPTSEINSKIELIKIAFEDAGGCDQDLIAAIIHSDFALVSFLLNVVFKSSAGCEDTAAKCLAFAGDIYSSLWTDYCAAAPRLLLVLQACKTASLRIEQLQYSLPAKASPNEHGAYLGYDERDIADFDMEGYEAGEDKTQQQERVLQIQEAVMVWFLFLLQVFSLPLPSINKKIISCRTRKSTGGRYSSRRVAKTAVPELTTDLFAEETTLDSLDLVEYFTGLAEALLGFLLKKGLSEDAHNQCVKVVVLLNAQLPRLQSADTNEVAALFAKLDSSGEAGENLTQGLLYLLNENGYPHIHSCDTLAAVRMCKDLLNVEYSPENAEDSDALGEGLTSPHSAQGSVDSSFARGHFYTNDVKVMVDIVVRELCNIPHNTSGLTTTSVEAGNGRYGSSSGSGGKSRSSPSSADQVAAVIHGTLRFAYLELLDAIVSRSTWTSSGDCYMKEQLRVQLEEVVSKKDGDEQSRLFAADLLAKYSYYLN